MLIQFNVENFLSFNNMQIFSMNAGKFRNNSERLYKEDGCKILKFMAIYGANAAGKSNLIDALGYFQYFVVNGFKKSSYPLYCKNNLNNANRPSLFEIKIKVAKKIFVYGFKAILSNSSFTEEWLYEELKNDNKKYIFQRNIINGKFNIDMYINSTKLAERLNIYGEDIKNDQSILFLKLMNQNKDGLYESNNKIAIFKQVYDWIKFKLDVNTPESPITNYLMLKDNVTIDLLARKLSSFSTGIERFDLIELMTEKVASNIPIEIMTDVKNTLLEQKEKTKEDASVLLVTPDHNIFIVNLDKNDNPEYKTLAIKHKNSDDIYMLSDESDGTIRLLDIIEVLVSNVDEKVYIIDEINRMFHPKLTLKFIEEFLELAKIRNVQLIVTTHESQLMDLKFLRKDEINFINKDEFGDSQIYSLDSYDDRFDKKVLNEYLKGKYDAIPHFD